MKFKINFIPIHLASQTWCLVRYLPLLIGDLVDQDDEYWSHYLDLMTITDYIFSPVTTESITVYMATLIEDYLADFRQLYPERRLTPKLHYLLHIPSYMRRYN